MLILFCAMRWIKYQLVIGCRDRLTLNYFWLLTAV